MTETSKDAARFQFILENFPDMVWEGLWHAGYRIPLNDLRAAIDAAMDEKVSLR
jgi:hypothetical protein